MATAINTNAVIFAGAPSAAVGEDATHFGVWTARDGGTFITGDVVGGNPAALELGDKYEFESGALVVTVPMGDDFSAAGAEWVLQGKFLSANSDTWVSVHDGDPLLTGANEMTDIIRVRISAWTVAA